MKNILIVSDGFLDGGFETRTQKELIEAKKHHYNFFLACTNYNHNHNVFKRVLTFEHPLSNYTNHMTQNKILTTRDQIISFCKQNKIDLIECHPFWCALPATLAAEKLHLPITFTLHGVTSGNFINPKPTNTALRALYYIIIKYGFDQIFAVAEYLRRQYSYLSPNILITRNGIDFPKSQKTPYSPNQGRFCIASRLDQPKTKLIKDFLPTLHALPEVTQIDIFGDGDQTESLREFIEQQELKKASLIGWQKDLPKIFANNHYTAIFGMGQVVTEAIASNTPTGVLGYGGFAGFINHENICHFKQNNFTDWESYSINLKKELQLIKKDLNNYLFSKKELSFLDQNKIWQEHFKIEESLIYSEKPVMHIINSLLDNHHGETLDIGKFLLKSNLPNTQNDFIYQLLLENIINTLKALEADKLKKDLDGITNSGFWKATKPLRKALNSLSSRRINKTPTR